MTERRRCTSCRCFLSQYNSDDQCCPCIERQRAASSTPWTVSTARTILPRRTASHLDQEQALIIEAIREHTTGPFKMMALRSFVNLRGSTISQLMIRAERNGQVVRVGVSGNGRTGGRTVTWDLPERRMEGVA